jgi:hypothetical protein
MQLKILKYPSLFLTTTLLTTGLVPNSVTADAGFRPLMDDYANLVNQGKCVDAQGSRSTLGTPLVLGDCNGSNSQQWSYDEQTRNLRNRAGKCIEVKSGNNRNGAALVLADCNRSKSQQWEHQGYRNSDNVRGLGGKCMATEDGSNNNGTHLVLQTCNNKAYQQLWGQALESSPTKRVAPTQGEVCLYELPEYKGWKKCFREDQPDFANLRIDNAVSSLTIYGNLKAKLYADANYRGVEQIYTQNTPWVNAAAVNNKFSSLKIDYQSGSQSGPSAARPEESSRKNDQNNRNGPGGGSAVTGPTSRQVGDKMSDPQRDSRATRPEESRPGDSDTQKGSGPQQDRYNDMSSVSRGSSPDQRTAVPPTWNSAENRTSQEFFTLTNHGKKCLEVHRGDFDARLNGGKVQIWDCNSTINQDWKLDNSGRLTTRNGKCLEVDSKQQTQDGARVQIGDCYNNRSTQQWYVDNGRLRHQSGGKCLDIDSKTMDQNGGRVQLWDCHERVNQRWVITYPQSGGSTSGSRTGEPRLDGSYDTRMTQEFFRLVVRGRCLDAQRTDFDSHRKGGKVQIWDCNNDLNQDWKFDSRGHLTSRNGQCLDIAPDAMNQNGALIQLWNCQDVPHQQWFLENNRIHNRGIDKCLDLDSGTMDKTGGKVQVWDCHDRANQKWDFMYH